MAKKRPGTPRLPLPAGTVGGRILLLGDREVTVEGCRGVLGYEGGCVRLNLGERQLKITGQGLCVRTLERNYCAVEGVVSTLSFE